MSYIDAGYAIALSVVFAYGALLFFRHRRMERMAVAVESSARRARNGDVRAGRAEDEG